MCRPCKGSDRGGRQSCAGLLPRAWRRRRRGAAIVEFAILAPLFFLIIFGIIEFGRAFMVAQVVTNASREGARRAVIEGATVSEVTQVVSQYLERTSVSGASVVVTPDSLATVGLGDPVTVTVSVPYSSVSWLPASRFLGGITLSATTEMRGERLQ